MRAFWQHTGLIVSSRQADSLLAGRPPASDGAEIATALRARLADFYDCRPDDVFLAPSGMAAQYEALQAISQRTPGRRTAQLGFPYVDTLKLQQKFGAGSVLLHDLQHIEQGLGE